MKKTLQLVTAAAASISLAACGASANGGATPNNVANITQNVLQLAVGTANYDGTSALNVVATYRQPAGGYAPGDSGTLLNEPTLTLPAGTILAANAATGNTTALAAYDPLSTVLYTPNTTEVGGAAITSSAQNPQNRTISSFGQSGGVFGLGIEPFNAQGSGSVSFNFGNPSSDGTPFQVAPYPVPLYDAAALPTTTAPHGTDANTFVPWGGPPAFVASGSNGVSIVGNSNYPSGDAGLSEGIDVFDIAPATGSYTLSLSIPTNNGTFTKSASATLGAVVTIPTPVNPTLTPDGTGGGSFAGWTMPAGATEAYIQVTDYGPAQGTASAQPASCNGSSEKKPVFYTVQVSGSGTPASLPDAIGPGGGASLCTAAANTTANGAAAPGDQYVIQVVAFDYPAFEASYPNSLKQPSPTITGSAGTDDLAVSGAACASTDGVTACDPLPFIKKREFAATYVKRSIIR